MPRANPQTAADAVHNHIDQMNVNAVDYNCWGLYAWAVGDPTAPGNTDPLARAVVLLSTDLKADNMRRLNTFLRDKRIAVVFRPLQCIFFERVIVLGDLDPNQQAELKSLVDAETVTLDVVRIPLDPQKTLKDQLVTKIKELTGGTGDNQL